MDAQHLVTALASLSQTATEDFSVDEMLRSLCEAASMALPVDGAGVMVCRDGRNEITGDPMTGQELLADADTAMYAAKQSGRGQVHVRDHIAASAIGYAHQLERDLVGALERGELRVHYQPIVDAQTRRVAAVEALLRWDQPEDGVLPAAAFIDIAVKSGLIVTIGRWVITQACQQMAAWQRELPDGASPATVCVNLSARELVDEDLPATISGVLADTGLLPAHLGIEIVEDDLADPAILQRLHQLHAGGHRLSVDDFGTGYSSLSRLLELPVDLAKIDKSFVAGLPGQDRWIRFVDGVVHLAGTLDLQVIAEGVETPAQADQLTLAGCQLLQGHHLARPQPADELSASWRLNADQHRVQTAAGPEHDSIVAVAGLVSASRKEPSRPQMSRATAP